MKLLITDTHFGVKQNSLTWLKSQENFIYKQLIPFIKNTNQEVTLVHLGDVFDSRSSVSTYIASRVIKIFESLKKVTKEIIIVSGNHDFYSPNSDEVDTNTLLLKQTGITIVSDEVLIRDNDLFVPWYKWFEQEYLQTLIAKHNITNVFTHADIVTEKVHIKGPKVFSGHIHIPNYKGKLINLGSTYALDFADANQERGFYTLTDKLEFYPNTESIKFWKLYSIPDFKINTNDYINLYIDMNNEDLLNKVKIWIKDKRNCTVFPLENINESLNEIEISDNYNIEQFCESLIPEKLKDKFNKIK